MRRLAVIFAVALLAGCGGHAHRLAGIFPGPGPKPTAVPSAAVSPTVVGTPTAGQSLSGTPGTWTQDPLKYVYQWEDCDSAGASCSAITGATSIGYLLASGDVGHTIRLQVTTSNGFGSTAASSAATAVVSGSGTSTGTGASLANCTVGGTIGGTPTSCTNVVYPTDGTSCGGSSTQTCGTAITVDDGSGTCSGSAYNVATGCTSGKDITQHVWPAAPGNLVTNDPTHPVPLVLVFSDLCTTDLSGFKNNSCFDNSTGSDGGTYTWTQISGADKFVTITMFADGSASFWEPLLYFYTIGNTCGTGGAAYCSQIPEVQGAVAWAEAHYSIDPNRIFASGGSKGGNFISEVACSTHTEGLFAGLSGGSGMFDGSVAGQTSPSPPSNNGRSCPALLSAGTFTPVSGAHPLMMQYWFSAGDGPTCTSVLGASAGPSNPNYDGISPTNGKCYNGGGLDGSGYWKFGFDQALTFVANPAFGCSNTPTAATDGNGTVKVRTYGSCTANSHNNVETQAVDYSTSACHAYGCDNQQGMGLLGAMTWNYWTTGTTTP